MQRVEMFEESGVKFYRSSSYGGCVRALVAARLGYESIERTKPFRPFERGHEAEDMAVSKLKELDWKITDRQLEVVLRVDPTHAIVCHIDGLIESSGTKQHLLEVKSMTSAGISPQFMEQYRWQISPAMIQLGLPCMMVKWNVDTNTFLVDYIEDPPHSLQDIQYRIASIEAYDQPSDASCNGNFPCPYFYLHDIPDLVHDPALTDAACDYLAAKARVDLANADLKVARAELESLKSDGKVVLDSGIVVNRYDITRATYDMKAMERDGLDIAPYRKITKSQALRVYTVDEDAE